MSDYGLIQPTDDGFKVSDDALDILLLPPSDPTHREAVSRLAFRPKVFAQLREEYGRELPSEINLKHKLVKSGFTESAAEDVISNYLATVATVGEAGEGSAMSEAEEALLDVDHEALDVAVKSARQRPVTAQGSADARQAQAPARHSAYGSRAPDASRVSETSEVRLSPNCRVTLSFEGPVTRAAIDKLIAFLKWNSDSYPEDSGAEGGRPEESASSTA